MSLQSCAVVLEVPSPSRSSLLIGADLSVPTWRGKRDNAHFGVRQRGNLLEHPCLLFEIESKGHRMGNGENFAKVPIGSIIEAEQVNFDAILKISLEKRFPICIGAINFERSHLFFVRVSNRGYMFPATHDGFKCISFNASTESSAPTSDRRFAIRTMIARASLNWVVHKYRRCSLHVKRRPARDCMAQPLHE
jgi:hypothetical protein